MRNKAVVKCLVQRAAALTCLLIQKKKKNDEINDDDNCIGIKREKER